MPTQTEIRHIHKLGSRQQVVARARLHGAARNKRELVLPLGEMIFDEMTKSRRIDTLRDDVRKMPFGEMKLCKMAFGELSGHLLEIGILHVHLK